MQSGETLLELFPGIGPDREVVLALDIPDSRPVTAIRSGDNVAQSRLP